MPGEVALVHDYLLVMRGAERTFAAIAGCWPDAGIATLLYDPEGTEGRFEGHTVTTSPLQRLGVGQRHFRALLPLFPLAVERLKLPPAGLVVSSSSAFAHGVRPPPGAAHVCYCHSPFRYVYHEREQALREVPRALRPALAGLLAGVRRWQQRAAQRPTGYIANSAITQQRIRDYWGRDSVIVHPPVDVERFSRADPEDFFLVVCELVRHKRVDIALEAARRAARPIVVVGEGPDRRRLEAIYGDGATFAGRLDDQPLAELYAKAAALVVPNVEEFGIAAVEAQAAGRPVIALDRGGTSETVVDGETGVLLASQDADSFAEAMADERFERFDPDRIQRQAAGFSRAEFQRKLTAAVEELSGLSFGGGAAATELQRR
jgi:glycosyltransferase involved in cell wall biosynthesis